MWTLSHIISFSLHWHCTDICMHMQRPTELLHIQLSLNFYYYVLLQFQFQLESFLDGCFHRPSLCLPLASRSSKPGGYEQREATTNKITGLTRFCGPQPRWGGTRNVKPIWILLKEETVSCNGISCAIYYRDDDVLYTSSAPCSAQITTPATATQVFLQAGCPSRTIQCLIGKFVLCFCKHSKQSSLSLCLIQEMHSNLFRYK